MVLCSTPIWKKWIEQPGDMIYWRLRRLFEIAKYDFWSRQRNCQWSFHLNTSGFYSKKVSPNGAMQRSSMFLSWKIYSQVADRTGHWTKVELPLFGTTMTFLVLFRLGSGPSLPGWVRSKRFSHSSSFDERDAWGLPGRRDWHDQLSLKSDEIEILSLLTTSQGKSRKGRTSTPLWTRSGIRDNARTLMQWSNSVTGWIYDHLLVVNPNYQEINVEAALAIHFLYLSLIDCSP